MKKSKVNGDEKDRLNEMGINKDGNEQMGWIEM